MTSLLVISLNQVIENINEGLQELNRNFITLPFSTDTLYNLVYYCNFILVSNSINIYN